MSESPRQGEASGISVALDTTAGPPATSRESPVITDIQLAASSSAPPPAIDQSNQSIELDQPSSSHTNIQVFNPAPTPTPQTPSELDETFFEPTLSDVQAHHASVITRSKRLNEAPLLTARYRDAEKSEKDKKRAEKWPTTTIRIKFSDGTQIQSTFPSSSPIQPVYSFVRSSLDPSASSKPFVLWQPPKNQYPEHPPSAPSKKPNPYRTTIIPPANYGAVRGGQTQGLQSGTGGSESLSELGLVPQSVLVVKWEDGEMNGSSYRAPLLPELLERSVPLPPTVPLETPATKGGKTPAQGGSASGTSEKKIPKWLQKGLMKKK